MKSNSQTKRFISFVLTLAMCLGMLGGVTFGAPAVVWADPGDPVTVNNATDLATYLQDDVTTDITLTANVSLPAGDYGKADLHKTLTLSGNNASLTIGSSSGGGGGTSSARRVSMQKITISGASGANGAVVINNNSVAVFKDCIFTGNTATSAERGGALTNYGTTILDSCLFTKNSNANTSSNSTRGLAGAVYNSGRNTTGYLFANNCVFASNTASTGNSYPASAICTYRAHTYVINSSIMGNSGAAAVYATNGTGSQNSNYFYALNSIFVGNEGPNSGADITATNNNNNRRQIYYSLYGSISNVTATSCTQSAVSDITGSDSVTVEDAGIIVDGAGDAVTKAQAYTYFSYPAIASISTSNVKVGYSENGTNITSLVSSATASDLVTKFYDGTDRSGKKVIGASKPEYVITWNNDDDSLIDTTTVLHGVKPAHSDAAKDSDVENEYTFKSWTPEIAVATGPATYTATYTSSPRKYDITWLNDDGSLIDKTSVAYGTMPSHADPTKKPDAQYTYTFANWDPEITTVAGIASYTAVYSTTLNQYDVNWVNYNGDPLETDQDVDYGTTPVYNGDVPTKTSDASLTYEFAGWNDGTDDYALGTTLPAIEGSTTFTAIYKNVPRVYNVTLNTNGGTVNSGNVTSYAVGPATPLPTDITYDGHSFSGWYDNPDFDGSPYQSIPANTTGDREFYAKWSDQTYTVRFMDENGTKELQKSEYGYQTIPEYTKATPEKDADAQNTYIFAGWRDSTTTYAIGTTLPAVTGGTRYYAVFEPHIRSYEITWTNEAGTEILATASAVYGSEPVYPGDETPTKTSTVAFTYTFDGWEDKDQYVYEGLKTSLAAVTGPATYKAHFDSTKNKYTITWLDENGSQLDDALVPTTEVEYGERPTHAALTKDADAAYRYVFDGWIDKNTQKLYKENEIPTVSGIATYQGKFSQVKKEYEITWKNANGDTLYSENVQHGQTPTYSGIEPTLAPTAQYTYYFNGWDPEIVPVTTDAAYTATYTAVTNMYSVTWFDEDGQTVLASAAAVEYGRIPEYTGSAPAKEQTTEHTYAFDGWWYGSDFIPAGTSLAAVTGDAIYRASYQESDREYTVTWKLDKNTVITTSAVAYDHNPVFPGADPIKPSDPYSDYEFAGWKCGEDSYDKNVTLPAIKGDTEFAARFEATTHEFTVSFYNENALLTTYAAVLSDIPVYTGNEPTKASDAAYTYQFFGWKVFNGDPQGIIYPKGTTLPAVTADIDFHAYYTHSPVYYTVTWNDYKGDLIITDSAIYEEIPRYPLLGHPTKPYTDTEAFEFAGWNDGTTSYAIGTTLPAIKGDTVFAPIFNTVTRYYDVNWYNGETKITTTALEFQQIPVYPFLNPTKAEDAGHTYTFDGWQIGTTTYAVGATLPAVTEDIDIHAVFKVNAKSYLISWFDENGDPLTSAAVNYGEMPVYPLAEPTKASDAAATYTFAGWDPAVTTVAGIASYTAVFDQHPYHYDVTWMYKGGTIIDNNVTHGSVVCWTGADPSQGSFLFTGWLKDDKDFYAKGEALPPVTANVTYEAQYIDTSEEYTVIWKNYDNTILTQSAVVWGTNPVYLGEEPTKPSDAEYNYKFNGWLHEGTTPYAIGATLPAVTTDTAFTAQFTTGEAIDQPLAFSVVSVSKTYGDATFQYLATGANDGGYRTYYSSDPYFASVDETSGIVTIHNAGTVTITAIAAATTKYKQATASYTLTVNKATLTLTAANKEAKTGEAVPALTYTVSGLKNGDTESGVTLSKPTLACNANMSAAGTYMITITGGSFSSNYEPAYVNGTLTVTQSSSGGGGGGGGGGSSGGGGGSSGGGGGGGSSSGGSSSTTTTTTTTTNTNQTISITVPEATTGQSSASFRDVEPNRWSANAITYVVSRGIFNGNGDGTFEPEVPMTRAMTAQVLYNLAGRPAVANNLSFSDRDKLLWFTDAVAWASSMGLITGEPDGTFRGNDNVTREQFVTILYRLAEKAGLDVTKRATLNAFRDSATVRDFSRNAMEWAVAVNLINGDEGRLNPDNSADREQIATMVMRFAIMLDEANKAAASSTKK